VTSANLIAGLVRLRRAKEQRALEAFVHCDGHYRRAERRLAAARGAVVQQSAQARARERALVDSILGRAISSTAMSRLQAELDALAAETARLQQQVEAAEASLEESRRARDAARERLGQCRRATIKLDHVAAQERRAAMRRQAALAEADDQIHAAAQAW
jgi:Mg2+ and Co2+ transporter CorA